MSPALTVSSAPSDIDVSANDNVQDPKIKDLIAQVQAEFSSHSAYSHLVFPHDITEFYAHHNNDLEKTKQSVKEYLEFLETNREKLEGNYEAVMNSGVFAVYPDMVSQQEGGIVMVWRQAKHVGGDDEATGTDATYWCAIQGMIRMRKEGHRRLLMIYDRNSAGRKNMDIKLIKNLLPVIQTHFPEMIEKIYIFPVNWVFWSMYNMVKGFLSKKMTGRLEILTSGWNEKIAECLTMEQVEKIMRDTQEVLDSQ